MYCGEGGITQVLCEETGSGVAACSHCCCYWKDSAWWWCPAQLSSVSPPGQVTEQCQPSAWEDSCPQALPWSMLSPMFLLSHWLLAATTQPCPRHWAGLSPKTRAVLPVTPRAELLSPRPPPHSEEESGPQEWDPLCCSLPHVMLGSRSFLSICSSVSPLTSTGACSHLQ